MFAVDHGFTKIVSGDCLNALPEDLMDIAPQVTMFHKYYWVVPEKIHTSPTDGILEILAGGGGVKDSGNPGGRGG